MHLCELLCLVPHLYQIWMLYPETKMAPGMTKNAKITNRINMCIFIELLHVCFLSTKVLPQWMRIPNMKSIKEIFFLIYRLKGAF